MSDQKPIPLIDVYAQNQPLQQEILAALQRVMETSSFILGPEVKAFEEEFAKHIGSKHGISCASGSDALLLPLMCAGVGPGDEVIVPSFTFYATAGAVARLGATPVFADSDDSYNISLEDMARKITSKTKAVIPVHLFGQMVDMKKLLEITNSVNHRILVIEDCAQSIGAEFQGRQCGNWGDCGAFSFYPTKNLGAMGDAGILSSNSDELNEQLRMVRVHGSKQRYFHELVGANSRLDSFQAAILRIKLKHLKTYEEHREKLAEAYTKQLKEAGLEEHVLLPVVGGNRKHVWNQFTIRAKRRDELKAHLANQKIGSEIYYPLAMHKQQAFRPFMNELPHLPLCEALEREVLSLPIYPEMDIANVERVVSGIKSFYYRN